MFESRTRLLAGAAGLDAVLALAACNRTANDILAGDRAAPTPNAPAEARYCYSTIGTYDCYAEPQPGQEARLIRAYPPEALLEAKLQPKRYPEGVAPAGAP